MGDALIKAGLGTLAIMLILAIAIAISQNISRAIWRRDARTDTQRAPRWRGHVEAAQSEALWHTRAPRVVTWLWRGLFPATLRARPDGLLLTPRGRLFRWWCRNPSAIIPWTELARGQERRLGRASIELGPSAVPLTRVSLSVRGHTAELLKRDTTTQPAFFRFVTPVPDGLAPLVNTIAQRSATRTNP